MRYQSTRDSKISVASAEAIAAGLAPGGGLFVPETIPKLEIDELPDIAKMTYNERAARILGMFLKDYSSEELERFCDEAYGTPGFDSDSTAPLRRLEPNTYLLELWHGPTCAFKDMALQMLPRLLVSALRKTSETREVCILVATSGDTGKAALEGFCDVSGTKIMVFYPRDGVSDIQKLQMTSQKGSNVNVVAVEGNFDDAQTGVKSIFSDKELSGQLAERGYFLSSANSINWGRLVPQIVYYVSAYCDLLAGSSIKPGEEINFCVPTGNFGNILAGYYAKQMGLPIKKLICASNRNDVLCEFINTGVYNKNRPFYTTSSPSMDILVSSNLERLLFDLGDKDARLTESYMSELAAKGRYEVADAVKPRIRDVFFGGSCSEEDTKRTISNVFEGYGYLMDTHTAVAQKVLADYRAETGDETLAVVVSTASPFKFCSDVLEALGPTVKTGGTELIDELSDVTGTPAPSPLAALKNAEAKFTQCVTAGEMKDAVLRFLEKKELQ